MEFIANTLIN